MPGKIVAILAPQSARLSRLSADAPSAPGSGRSPVGRPCKSSERPESQIPCTYSPPSTQHNMRHVQRHSQSRVIAGYRTSGLFAGFGNRRSPRPSKYNHHDSMHVRACRKYQEIAACERASVRRTRGRCRRPRFRRRRSRRTPCVYPGRPRSRTPSLGRRRLWPRPANRYSYPGAGAERAVVPNPQTRQFRWQAERGEGG